jgi:hypothetical protein
MVPVGEFNDLLFHFLDLFDQQPVVHIAKSAFVDRKRRDPFDVFHLHQNDISFARPSLGLRVGQPQPVPVPGYQVNRLVLAHLLRIKNRRDDSLGLYQAFGIVVQKIQDVAGVHPAMGKFPAGCPADDHGLFSGEQIFELLGFGVQIYNVIHSV